MFWKEIYRWIWILYTRTNCVTLKNLRYYTNWTRLMLTVALPVLALIFFNTKIFMGIRCTMMLQFFHFSLLCVFQMKNKAFLVRALLISRSLNLRVWVFFSFLQNNIFANTHIRVGVWARQRCSLTICRLAEFVKNRIRSQSK